MVVRNRETRQPDVEPAWTVGDVAAFLRASESTVRKRVAAGKIPCHRVGRLVRFDPTEIREWLLNQTQGGS